MQFRLSTPTTLYSVGGVLITLGVGVAIAGVVSIHSYNDGAISLTILGAILMVIGGFIVNAGSAAAREAEVERIRSLGVRVAATVTHISERDDDDTGIKGYIHATWRDPETEKTYTMTSHPVSRALARSYREGDPVVVFIDPANPTNSNHFEVVEQP